MIGVYARQSVEKKDSISIETQIDKCVRMIDDPKIDMNYKVYMDRGYSGSNMDRPDFIRMLHDIEAGMITKVIVYKVDRFSRSLIDFFNVYKILEKHGVDFVSLNDNFDTSTPTGRAMLSITLVFAQLERETIAMRVKDNYYARASLGRALGGKTHYGYRKIQAVDAGKTVKRSVPDEIENPHLIQMFQWYDEGCSLSEICTRLKALVVPAPMGGKWESSKVSKILHNPFYVQADVDVYAHFLSKGCHITNDVSSFDGDHGLLLYGQRDRNLSKYNDLTNQYVSIGLHAGVITSDQWLRVQYKLEANEQIKNSGKGSYTWLSGLTKCGYCGYAMTYVAYREGRNYLNCRGKTNFHLCGGHSAPVLVEDMEELIEAVLLEKIASLAHLAEQVPPAFDEHANKIKMQLVGIDKEYEDYMGQLRHADDYLRKHITTRLKALEEKQNKLAQELQKRLLQAGVSDAAAAGTEALLAMWQCGNLEHRKKISKKLIDRVDIKDDGAIQIVWRVPE